jgi:hypothetical protein
MQPDADIVESLVVLNGDVDSIKEIWQSCLQALVDRASITVHVNQSAQQGRSSGGIVLADESEIRAFIAACREAVRRLEADGDEDADQFSGESVGRGTDRSFRAIRV